MSLLHHELGVVVVDLPTKQCLHGACHLAAASHHASDVLPRMVPEGHVADLPLAVRHCKGVLDDPIVPLDILIEVGELLLSQERPAGREHAQYELGVLMTLLISTLTTSS